MQFISDEAKAFSVLESFGAADFDFTTQQARFLRSPQQVVFFLFCPAGKLKGARVFVFDNPPVAGEIESSLFNEVLKLAGDEHADSLREHASEVILEYLETKQAGHYFFDAH